MSFMITKEPFYQTANTDLAAYLLSEGFPVIEIQYEPRSNGNKQRGLFIFDRTDKIIEKVNLYETGKATINLALFQHAKARLFDRLMGGLP